MFSSLVLAASLGIVACGSDEPKQAETAEPGSEFCELSQVARDAGADIDVTSTDADELEQQIGDALESSKKAAEAAPADFEDLAEESIEFQERFIEILEDADYDVVAATATDAGKELFQDPRYTEIQEERDEYLQDKCDIAPSEGGENDSDITLAAGEEGIRQLFSLLQLSPDAEVTDEQVECAVEGLAGNISDEDLAGIANQGTISVEGRALFNEVAASCGITLAGS